MKTRLPLLMLGILLAAACATGDEYTPEDHTAEFHIENAQRLYDGQHYEKSLQQFGKALELDSDNEAALLGRAWCLLFLGERQVQEGSRRADDTLDSAEEAFLGLQEIDYGANQFKVDLGLGKVHVLYGNLYARRADLIDRRVSPEHGASPSETQAIETSLAERDTEYAKAEKHFKAVLARKDNAGARDNLTALIHLGRIAVIQREYPEALVYTQRYLAQVEKSKNLWVKSAIKFPRDKDIWEAKLAGAVTKEVEARDLIAGILYKLGRLELADKELTQLIFLSPERADAYLNRGIVRDELGKKPLALADYREFMVRAARIDMAADDKRVLKATERIMELEEELGLPPTIRLPGKGSAPKR